MIWHIVKREIYDNLNNLRFALATVLLLALMLTNAIVHLRVHPKRIQQYNNNVTEYQNRLKLHAEENLYSLAKKGPGNLYKKPSSLRFCGPGDDEFFSDMVVGEHHRWITDGVESFWVLTYPSVTPNLKNINPDITEIDWAFVIGYALSLIALLFTFDAVAGEHERGTLRLVLVNSIPRSTVWSGKFLGALISISIPFTLAVLINLLVISSASNIHLGADVWGRLGIIFLIGLLYTCLFIGLGLLVSSSVKQSAVSLIILLLVWVTFVGFMPSSLVSIASRFSPSMPSDEFQKRKRQIRDEHQGEYYNRRENTLETSSKRIEIRSVLATEEAEQQERLNEEYLDRQIGQVQRARDITRISPTMLLWHLLESFAGTGFKRHLQFVENAQQYAHQYREFVVDTDRTDPQSLHLIGVLEGISNKKVSPESIPKFEDTLNLSRDFNTATMDLLLLVILLIVLLLSAYLVFVCIDV